MGLSQLPTMSGGFFTLLFFLLVSRVSPLASRLSTVDRLSFGMVILPLSVSVLTAGLLSYRRALIEGSQES